MSILFSIIRIAPPMRRLRTAAKLVSVLFACFFILLVVQKIYACEHNQSWHHTLTQECRVGDRVAITEICSESYAAMTSKPNGYFSGLYIRLYLSRFVAMVAMGRSTSCT